MTLTWHGDRIVRAIEASAERQTHRVVDAAVEQTKANTPVLTGAAKDSVRKESSSGREVVWGYHVGYGVFIEIGWSGATGNHAMRGAADATYPALAPGIASDWPGRLAGLP